MASYQKDATFDIDEPVVLLSTEDRARISSDEMLNLDELSHFVLELSRLCNLAKKYLAAYFEVYSETLRIEASQGEAIEDAEEKFRIRVDNYIALKDDIRAIEKKLRVKKNDDVLDEDDIPSFEDDLD
jgi:hypothetical protein